MKCLRTSSFAVDFGSIKGPYVKTSQLGKRPMYQYSVCGIGAWEAWDRIEPYLSPECVKRKKLIKLETEGVIKRDGAVVLPGKV